VKYWKQSGGPNNKKTGKKFSFRNWISWKNYLLFHFHSEIEWLWFPIVFYVLLLIRCWRSAHCIGQLHPKTLENKITHWLIPVAMSNIVLQFSHFSTWWGTSFTNALFRHLTWLIVNLLLKRAPVIRSQVFMSAVYFHIFAYVLSRSRVSKTYSAARYWIHRWLAIPCFQEMLLRKSQWDSPLCCHLEGKNF
jgi:hypothetical protein